MIKWQLPEGDFMLCKKDKRFTGHIAYVSFEASKINKPKYRLGTIEKSSVFQKDSDNLLLLQTKYAKTLSRWMKKKMLMIIGIKKV